MTNGAENHISLSEYWQGIQSALDATLHSSKKYLRHPISGLSAEDYFRDLLRRYLPVRYAVEAGFVVNAKGVRSNLIDIIIADKFHIPPLCSEPNYKVFAVESVCAVIEVTTSPKAKVKQKGKVKKEPKFKADIVKLAKVREMGKIREYIDMQTIMIKDEIRYLAQSLSLKASPRAFLITSGDEWKNKETYEENLLQSLRDAKNEGNELWINAYG